MLVVGPNVVVRGHGSSDVYFIVAGFFKLIFYKLFYGCDQLT